MTTSLYFEEMAIDFDEFAHFCVLPVRQIVV